jgi:hypothetical protein
MVNAIMLCVALFIVMLSVIMLSAVMLNVVAPVPHNLDSLYNVYTSAAASNEQLLPPCYYLKSKIN